MYGLSKPRLPWLSKYFTVLAFWGTGLISAFLGRSAYGQECSPVDLRSNTSPPIRSQLYTNETKSFDSRYCYAFTLANLMSQKLGVAISPIDIAVQYIKSWPSHSSSEMFPLNFGWGGDLLTVFNAMKAIGYCTTQDFTHYERSIQVQNQDWYMALNQQAHFKSSKEIFADIDRICSSRMREPLTLQLKHERNDESTRELKTPFTSLSARKMIQKVNRLLDSGQVVALSYNNHYVTIVGRSNSCEFIVQDSIPHSYRMAKGFRNLYHHTEGEHIQFWSLKALNIALHWDSADGAIPGILYLEDHSSLPTN